MVLNEPIPGWGSILILGLTILGSTLRALTCPSVEKPYSSAGQLVESLTFFQDLKSKLCKYMNIVDLSQRQ